MDLEALWEGTDCSFIALTWDCCACDLLWDGVEGAELWKAWALCSVGGRQVPSIVDGLLATPQDPHRSITLELLLPWGLGLGSTPSLQLSTTVSSWAFQECGPHAIQALIV